MGRLAIPEYADYSAARRRQALPVQQQAEPPTRLLQNNLDASGYLVAAIYKSDRKIQFTANL